MYPEIIRSGSDSLSHIYVFLRGSFSVTVVTQTRFLRFGGLAHISQNTQFSRCVKGRPVNIRKHEKRCVWSASRNIAARSGPELCAQKDLRVCVSRSWMRMLCTFALLRKK